MTATIVQGPWPGPKPADPIALQDHGIDALPPDPPNRERASRPADREFVRDGCYVVLHFGWVPTRDLRRQHEEQSEGEESPALTIHVRRTLRDAWQSPEIWARDNPLHPPIISRRHRAPGYREPVKTVAGESHQQRSDRLTAARRGYEWPPDDVLERWVDHKVAAALQALRRRYPPPDR